MPQIHAAVFTLNKPVVRTQRPVKSILHGKIWAYRKADFEDDALIVMDGANCVYRGISDHMWEDYEGDRDELETLISGPEEDLYA